MTIGKASELRKLPDASTAAPRPARFTGVAAWWHAHLRSLDTGIAAVVSMIAIFNTQQPEPRSVTQPPSNPMVLPAVDWNAKSAVLISPLQQEYENLQADLKKAEKVLKEDIGL